MQRLLILAVALLAVTAVLVIPAPASPAAEAAYQTLKVSYSVPVWSPDGTRIAWASNPFVGRGFHPQPPPPSQIWTANVDGSDAAPLIGGLINGPSQIVWPRPQEILYDTFGMISLARLDGTHKRVLHSTGTTFSTDAKGTRIASAPDFGGPIIVLRAESGKRIRIRGAKFDPTLAPDGRRIAFNHGTVSEIRAGGSQYGLFVARANGTGMHRIAPHGYCATWSPRGNEIAFMTLGALRVVRPNGSHERLLVRHAGTCSVPPLMAWSPDGRQIAYVRGHLVVVDVASGHRKKLWALGKGVTGVAWSPDSKRLLVTARQGPTGCSSLWKIDASGKNRKLIRPC